MADGKAAQAQLQTSNWEAEFRHKFDTMCQQYWRGWEERRIPPKPASMEQPPGRALVWCPSPQLASKHKQARRHPHPSKEPSKQRSGSQSSRR
ncbi:Hypothetical predicted protein [Pelobates cultripes]|uniref:Uncharacterized protein n=1 Tax=Pelobates cultripes TaxID=61616 RepID=A0AAD1RSG8_PELCU|nr:Hypothetical predicted protein [Pelobates cultripes]